MIGDTPFNAQNSTDQGDNSLVVSAQYAQRVMAKAMIDKLPAPPAAKDSDAKPSTGGTPAELKDIALTREEVEAFLYDIKHQPNWRKEADKAADYYDGNQLTQDTVEKLKDRGQPPLITNLIKPNIDTVLGLEAKTRTDWIVRPEDDNEAESELAEALSVKLKHAEIESRADRACSDAYAAQIKAGMGWVEVSRDTDPFKPAHRVSYVHRREIFWDWRSEKSDLSDCRYLIRRRWMQTESAIALMPQYARLFRETTSAWSGFDPIMEQDTGLVRSFNDERDTRLEATDWRDIANKRVCLNEIWYRKWVKGHVMLLPNGRVVEFDLNRPDHCEAVIAGIVKVREAVYQRVRLAWYCGPHFLYDIASPYKHYHFPYVPFFGYREDLTSAPYGLIRSMMSPQDEVNARKSKQLWLLNSRRTIADADAVVDHSQTMQEVARADSYIILNPNRRPNSRFEIELGSDLVAAQAAAMIEAKGEINEASGIHKSMLGQASNASSGTAINQLIEQGINTLAEINDNYNFARRLVGEILFSLVQEDLSGHPVTVKVGDGNAARAIVLNEPAQDEQGQPYLKNDVSRVKPKIVLDDIRSTPTYRMQVMTQLAEITKSLPPQAQGALADMWVEASDLPGKARVVDRLRTALNLPDDSPQGRKAAQEQAQQQQQQQQQAMQLAMAEQQAKIAELEAKANKLNAEAEATGAETQDGGAAVSAAREQHMKQMQQMQQTILKLQQQIAQMQLQAQSKKEELTLKRQESLIDARTKVGIAHLQAKTQLETAQIGASAQKDTAKLSAETQVQTAKIGAAAQKQAAAAKPKPAAKPAAKK